MIKSLSIPVRENKRHVMLLSRANGKFSEGEFIGEFFTDGATMLFNLSDGRQFCIRTTDILIALKSKLKSDPSGYYEKKNGKWIPKKQKQ